MWRICGRSITLTPEIQEWIVAQWQAEVATLPWFEALSLTPDRTAALTETMSGCLERLLTGDRVDELYGEMTLVARRQGVRNTDIFQASTKLESILTGLILQLFPSSDQQTVALVTLTKFLKSLLCVVMETYRRESENELEGRNRELASALEQQTATSEVLEVINASPGDLAPVFDAMLERAVRLCDAKVGSLWTYDGARFQLAAIHGGPPDLAEIVAQSGQNHDPMSARGRALRGEHVTHVLDARESEAYLSGDPVRLAMVHVGGGRTLVTVSLRKDDTVLGLFTIYRQEVRPFSDKQIALLQNFAAQAVIGMENARLITETREALERQIATAEVLQVINASPGDLAPVFGAMLDEAMRLCRFEFGILFNYDGEVFRPVAFRGAPPAYVEWYSHGETAYPFPGTVLGQIVEARPFGSAPDVAASMTYGIENRAGRALVELGGARTVLAVPLRKDERLLGTIAAYRQEVRPFSDKQIALLQNFAAQAVIAMENAALNRDARGPGAANGNRRGAAGHQFFTRRSHAGVRCDAGKGVAAVRGGFREPPDL